MQNQQPNKIVLPSKTLSGIWTNSDGPLMVTQYDNYVQLSDGIGVFMQDGWINASFPGDWQGKVKPQDDSSILLWNDDGGTWNRLHDITGVWKTNSGKVQLAQLDSNILGINISGALNNRIVKLSVDGSSKQGKLSFNDQFIVWENGDTWERTLDTTGVWVVVQDQPKINNIPGTGVQKGTQLELQQDDNGVISSKIPAVNTEFSVNGRFIKNDVTLTGNFPFGLGLGWLEYTLMSLQWHTNRFNRVIDLNGSWQCAGTTHTIKQSTPNPLKQPAVGTLTIDQKHQATVNRTWVKYGDLNGIVNLNANTINFENGDCWKKA